VSRITLRLTLQRKTTQPIVRKIRWENNMEGSDRYEKVTPPVRSLPVKLFDDGIE
jgi:hypothetical protein